MTTEQTTRCVACREKILVGAIVCKHCGTSQSKNPKKSISDALKWVGGVVTVISMLIGAITLSGYYSDWRQRNAAVAELVGASKWLIRAYRYAEAWDSYEQALELSPGSAEARRGRFELAQTWLREFSGSSKEEADELLNEISAVLYRGLADANDDEVATILAHVALAQVLRYEHGYSILTPEQLLEEALAASPRNAYANAVFAYWVLIRKGAPPPPEEVRKQEARFEIALEDRDAHDWVRGVQLYALAKNSYGSDSEHQRALLAALLRAGASMKRNGEERPAVGYRIDLFKSYGFMARATNVESSLSALPPREHLELLDWLAEDLDGEAFEWNPLAQTQLQFVRVRLLEELGDTEAALAGYRELLTAEQTRDGLDRQVNLGIQRLTGELPERATARTYVNDPLPDGDPWTFHLGTLRHWDPKWIPGNYTAARDFFFEALESGSARLPSLTATLTETLPRVREVVREGEELERINGWHGMFSVSNFRLLVENYSHLSVLQALALLEAGEPNRGIATLNDAALVLDDREGDWEDELAMVTFTRALIHARRAATVGDEGDADLALKHLLASAQRTVDLGFVDWEQIKGEDFAVLAARPGYRELVRGR